MIRDELEGIWNILLKDLKAYYFKPPNISWGILFPLVLALAFTLRNPGGLAELSPGLIAMAALFVTTSIQRAVEPGATVVDDGGLGFFSQQLVPRRL